MEDHNVNGLQESKPRVLTFINSQKLIDTQSEEYISEEMYRDRMADLAEVQYKKRLNPAKELMDRGLFGEFQQHIPQQPETGVATAYAQAFHRKKLSSGSKGKRIKAANKKLEIYHQINTEKARLAQDRTTKMEGLRQRLKKSELDQIDAISTSQEEKEAIFEWMVQSRKENGVEKNYIETTLFREDSAFRQSKIYLRDFAKVDVVGLFSYKSDRQFADRFAEKYELLVHYAMLRPMLERFERESHEKSHDLPLSQIRAKIRFCEEMKKDYESKIAVLQSPYYVNLAQKDVEKLQKEENLEELKTRARERSEDDDAEAPTNELITFVDYYRNYQQVKLKDPAARMKEIYTEEQQIVSERDERRLKESLERTKYDPKALSKDVEKMLHTSPQDMFFESYQTRKEALLKSYAPDDVAFIHQVPIYLDNGLVNSASASSFTVLEEKLATFIQTGTLNGTQLTEEQRQAVQPYLEELIADRRAFLASTTARIELEEIVVLEGADTSNPTFLKTDIAKKLMPLIKDKGNYYFPQKIMNDLEALQGKYITKLFEVCSMLHEKGLSIYPEYEEKLNQKEKVDAALQRAVESEKVRNANFTQWPTATVNGKTYTLYRHPEELAWLCEGSYVIEDGANSEEIVALLARIEEELKWGTAAYELLKFPGEEAALTYHYLTLKHDEQRARDVQKINKLKEEGRFRHV